MASDSCPMYQISRAGSESSLHSQSTYGDPEFDSFIADLHEDELSGTAPKVTDDDFEVPIRDILTDDSASDPFCTPVGTATSSSSDSGSKGKRRSFDGEPSDSFASRPRNPNNLSPHVITDHRPTCAEFLPFCVQWEYARLTNMEESLTYSQLQGLKRFKTHEEQVLHVYNLLSEDHKKRMTLYEAETMASSPWQEMDLEANAKKHDVFGMLGCNEDKPYLASDPTWYGGKVHLRCKLTSGQKGSKQPFQITLEKPRIGPSTRFSRRFGSDNFIRVKIAQSLFYSSSKKDDLLEYFYRPFRFNDRVYRAFYAKDTTVFLVRTAEEWCRREEILKPSRNGLSFLDFLDWHNLRSENQHQSMAKWTARFALGLSSSVPGIRIAPENIILLPDIENVEPSSAVAKTPSHLVMTDGCGFASQALLSDVNRRFGWDTHPTLLQARFEGIKGLCLRHPSFRENVPRVWIRPSQTKIHYPSVTAPGFSYDPAMYTIDVLRSSHMTSPARLSAEVIINLAENGVRTSLLTGLLQTTLEERLAKLLRWKDTAEDLRVLWDSVAKEGCVTSARLSRTHTSTARLMGYRFEDPEEEVEDELDPDELQLEHSNPWWADPVSGQPSSLEETVLHLLDSGFNPFTSSILQVKLSEVVKKAVKSCTQYGKAKIEVKQSCTGFVVPDPCGVLEPGEVHIKSSSRNLIDVYGNPTDIVMGDVLLTRHPCKVASDVQKARAVFKAELHDYVDVIVLSTKGHKVKDQILPQHLVSMTGGGDFDGDVMFAYWAPELVQDFKEADPSLAFKPPGLDALLVKPKETVKEFMSRITPLDEYQSYREHQKYLLGGVRNPEVPGKVNGFWEHSTYMNGYKNPETHRMAYLFCEALDGSKTGVSIDPVHYSSLLKKYGQPVPWKADTSKDLMASMDNRPKLKRPDHLGPFIMDELNLCLAKLRDEWLQEVDKKLDPSKSGAHAVDEDLTAPFKQAKERAKRLDQEPGAGGAFLMVALTAIEEHVEKTREKWRMEHAKTRKRTSTKAFTDAPIEQRQDALRAVSREFWDFDPPNSDAFSEPEQRRLMASCAYDYNARMHGAVRFPFDIAFRELCTIKADAVSRGRTKSILPGFYEGMSMSKKYVKADLKTISRLSGETK